MAKKVITTLEGRQKEICLAAGQRLMEGMQAVRDAQVKGIELEQILQDALEMATGDKDPATLILNGETGEVFRETVPQKRKPRGGRKTTPKGKGRTRSKGPKLEK